MSVKDRELSYPNKSSSYGTTITAHEAEVKLYEGVIGLGTA
ncbi:MAG: hypothetical protein AAFO89_11005 [Planctomycetota bacterium]